MGGHRNGGLRAEQGWPLEKRFDLSMSMKIAERPRRACDDVNHNQVSDKANIG